VNARHAQQPNKILVTMRTAQSLCAVSWACAFQPAFRPAAHNLNPGRLGYGARLFSGRSSADDALPLTPDALCQRAMDFLRYKNAAGRGDANLDPVFDMCSPEANVYGLRGESIRPGLTAFFEEHGGLQHELLSDPTAVGPLTVQYPFVKTWRENGEGQERRWSSIDPEKPRDKVERLDFDDQGRLVRVSVVETSAPLEPLG